MSDPFILIGPDSIGWAMSETSRAGIWNSGIVNTSEGYMACGSLSLTCPTERRKAWQSVADAIEGVRAAQRTAAGAKLDDLREEVAKSNKADDRAVARSPRRSARSSAHSLHLG
jgi:hypothetical protein